MNPHTSTEHARLFNADLRRWPEVLAPGSVVLSHIDGPYDLRKADWDCLTHARKSYAGIPGEADRVVRAYLDLLDLLGDRRGADLVAWYAPILHTISEASAASASAYLWNTDAGEALLRPVMVALGWTFKTGIIWDKLNGTAAINPVIKPWVKTSEHLGFYIRGVPFAERVDGGQNVWSLAMTAYFDERITGEPQKSGLWTTTSLHPTQKPLAFADRVIRASSRPGDLVVDWFGGTCRLAVANARLPLADRRQIVAFELDRRYLDAVAPSLSFVAAPTGGHPSLFGEP